ncbi:LOW QUALITY PROTEIN: dehydrodolichyl diphosphate synthase 2 [Carica papaya]|uniref:LOW QUALITY PROTEIN: dehydrodolichyl diphosphate synthase 2 n=1 Tax=Carica papaya TaxID=3649 RepID=UPI000B8CB528|nr:LOW QUALITY PROTEIN: dehydrodolichyl diphosphate synthase 2 [Carica papaya]
MLSLNLPVQVPNTFPPLKPKPTLSSSQVTGTATGIVPTTGLSSCSSQISIAKRHELRATTAGNVAIQEEDNDGSMVAGEEELPEGLQRDLMPKHVAIIMDGNVRWAKQRGLPSSGGHQAGVESLRKIVELCGRWGIQVLTVFAFSTDNWIRPKVEVDFLMSLFERSLKTEVHKLAKQGIRISIIGDSSKLSKSLQTTITEVEEMTKHNSRLQLIVAVSYSGKYDVLQACRSIAQKVKKAFIQLDDINEQLIEQELETNCTEFPYPDLLIRTSGELRVSNFLLWQLAYTELYFAPDLWPDFGKEEFAEALTSFQQRQRRYGARSQLTEKDKGISGLIG